MCISKNNILGILKELYKRVGEIIHAGLHATFQNKYPSIFLVCALAQENLILLLVKNNDIALSISAV